LKFAEYEIDKTHPNSAVSCFESPGNALAKPLEGQKAIMPEGLTAFKLPGHTAF
jgi:hypothetical protein